MNSDIRVRAFAKINRSLRVLGTRDDGYHELRTVFQSIALYDTVVVRRRRGPFALTVRHATPHGGRGAIDRPSTSPDVSAPPLAADRTNLVSRAAEALWSQARRRGSVRDIAIHLIKRIPMAAGLGGGSSDAAATLRALAGAWRVGDDGVRQAAVRLGADVPFFLEGGTVLGLERGDVLFPLVDRPCAWVVLVVPPFGVSTPDAYRWWDALPGRARRRATPGAADAMGVNDLQDAVVRRHPEIARIVSALTRAGADCAAMSGSGSAVFGLFRSRDAAERTARRLASPERVVRVTRTLTRREYRRLAGT